MLNIKNLTLLSQKKEKKAEILTMVAKKNRPLLDFYCNQVSRFGLILTKI